LRLTASNFFDDVADAVAWRDQQDDDWSRFSASSPCSARRLRRRIDVSPRLMTLLAA
jgi:hypothetical protein